MKIDDLLSIAGASQVKTFKWGAGVVEVINTLLPEERQLTPEVTGQEAAKVMRAMPPSALMELFSVEIDKLTGQQITRTPDQVVAVDVKVVPTARNLKHWLVFFIAGSLVLIALASAWVTTAVSVRDGQTPDTRVLQTLVQVLGDIVKTLITGKEAKTDKEDEDAPVFDDSEEDPEPRPQRSRRRDRDAPLEEEEAFNRPGIQQLRTQLALMA